MAGAEQMNIRRLLEAQVDTHYAIGAVTAITAAAAYTAIPVTGTVALDAASISIPPRDCLITQATLHVSLIALATQVQWCVSRTGVAPFHRITPVRTTLIDIDPALATGTVTAVLGQVGIPYSDRTGLGTSGTLWILARTPVGTCSVQPFLEFVAKTDGLNATTPIV